MRHCGLSYLRLLPFPYSVMGCSDQDVTDMCTLSLILMALSYVFRYVEVMTPLRFREHALVESNDFHFRQALSAGKQGDAFLCHLQPPKAWPGGALH